MKFSDDKLAKKFTRTANGRLLPSFFIGLLLFIICSLALRLFSTDLTWHFLIITSFTAAFASADFIDACRGRRDFFSPRAITSILMVLSVYIAPVVHILLEAYPRFVNLPTDMVEAFTALATLQLVGLFFYFLVLRLPLREDPTVYLKSASAARSTAPAKSFRVWIILLAFMSLALFIYTVMYLGGPQSWLVGQLNRSERGVLPGVILTLAEAFPLLFFIGYCLYLKTSSLSSTELKKRLLVAFALLVLVTFLTSGLRGSRASLVWPALSGLVMIHLLFFKVRSRVLAVIALIGIVFAGVYDIYKKTGPEGLEQLQGGSVESLNDYVGYSFGPTQLLLGDFSRTAEQAIILDRWKTQSFDPYWGLTYLGDIIAFIPGAERVEALPSKSVAGTEVFYGEGSSWTREKLSTRIYGLQGEALMNFGPLGAVMIFVPYAFVVRWVERAFSRAKAGRSEGSAVFVPLLLPATALLFLSDLDNVVNNLTSIFILPALAAVLTVFTLRKKVHRKASEIATRGQQ